MTTLAKATVFSNSWQIIYDLLVANLTDPASRGDNNNWIFAAFPDTDGYGSTWQYPIIMITSPNIAREPLTMNRDKVRDEILIAIDVYTTSAIRMDSITDDIFNQIDSNKTTLATNGLYNYSITSTTTSRVEIDQLKLHNKTIMFRAESILA